MIVDYHMHLRGPANGREGAIELTVEAVQRFVEQAAARRVDEIAFTEHMYYFRQAEPLLGHPYHRARVARGVGAQDLRDLLLAAREPLELERELHRQPLRLGLEDRAAVVVEVAHDVGRDLDAGIDLLTSVGYETVTVFDARVGHQEGLG